MRNGFDRSQEHEKAATRANGKRLDEVDRPRLKHESNQKPRTTCHVPDGDQLWKLLLVVAIHQVRDNCPDHHVVNDDLQRAIIETQAQSCSGSSESSRDLTSAYLELVIDSILERLPPHHRMIVALRLDGCEIAQVASLTKRSMRSVERILHESRDMLASLLNEREVTCT